MIERTLFTDEHRMFRDSVRRFMDNEVVPHHEQWEDQGYVDREVWRKAGGQGLLCATMPEEYGGAGADKLYSIVVMEEIARANATGLGFGLHSEIVAPYILHYGSDEQKRRFLPKMASGESIGAIAMSEPAAGSDLQGVRTTAVRKGDVYVLNGSKTFITNGFHADVVIVVAKTRPDAGAKGTSLLLVERGMKGFEKGKRLKKVGMKAQDTSELFFDDVQVPAANVLGAENQGFVYLMQELPWERLQIAIGAVRTRRRRSTGRSPTCRKQGVRHQRFFVPEHALQAAELQTEVQIARVFVDRCIELLMQDKLDTATASMAKYWCSDLQCRCSTSACSCTAAMATCGEYPVARAWADARVQRIYGGTNEIMKEVITRSMGLGGR